MTHQDNYIFTKKFEEKGMDANPEKLQVLINQVMQAEIGLYNFDRDQ